MRVFLNSGTNASIVWPGQGPAPALWVGLERHYKKCQNDGDYSVLFAFKPAGLALLRIGELDFDAVSIEILG